MVLVVKEGPTRANMMDCRHNEDSHWHSQWVYATFEPNLVSDLTMHLTAAQFTTPRALSWPCQYRRKQRKQNESRRQEPPNNTFCFWVSYDEYIISFQIQMIIIRKVLYSQTQPTWSRKNVDLPPNYRDNDGGWQKIIIHRNWNTRIQILRSK